SSLRRHRSATRPCVGGDPWSRYHERSSRSGAVIVLSCAGGLVESRGHRVAFQIHGSCYVISRATRSKGGSRALRSLPRVFLRRKSVRVCSLGPGSPDDSRPQISRSIFPVPFSRSALQKGFPGVSLQIYIRRLHEGASRPLEGASSVRGGSGRWVGAPPAPPWRFAVAGSGG